MSTNSYRAKAKWKETQLRSTSKYKLCKIIVSKFVLIQMFCKQLGRKLHLLAAKAEEHGRWPYSAC